LGVVTYALAVVGALTVASCLVLGIGLALNRGGRTHAHPGHAPGGRLLSPPDTSGLWGDHDAWVSSPSGTSRADGPEAGIRSRRRRPLTADQQATREAWARWRAEQGRTRP
jgi:hypothetical protein